MRFKSMGNWCGCGCKRWMWEVQWCDNLKTTSSGIWVIKMRTYHESFIFVTGNSYSCAHSASLNIRLSWDRLTFIMVKNRLYIKMPLGSSAAMMFLFLIVPNIWQWMSFKLSFEIMLKTYSNLYLSSFIWSCGIRIVRPLWNLICRGNVKYLTWDMNLIKFSAFVDIDLSILYTQLWLLLLTNKAPGPRMYWT